MQNVDQLNLYTDQRKKESSRFVIYKMECEKGISIK